MSVFNFFELKSQPQWDEYVTQHPNGSVFHLSAMFRAFEASQDYSPFNIAACNHEGEIVAMLAAVKVNQSCEGFLTNTTSHSVMYAEPLCNNTDEGASALVQLLNMYDRVWSKESLFSEIRPVECTDQQAVIFLEQNYQRLNSRNLVVDLARLADAKVDKCDTSNVDDRPIVTKNFKIDRVSPRTDLNRVSDFIHRCCQEKDVANAQVNYLKSLVEHLPNEIIRMRIASIDGIDVAVAMGLIFKGRYVSWYKMTSEELDIESVLALVWDEIDEAHRLNLSKYDFGNSDWRTKYSHSDEVELSFENARISRSYYKKLGLKLSMALKQKENFVQGHLPKFSLCDSQTHKGAHYD